MVWTTAASREGRRIGAALLASLFLIGTLASARSCPRHDGVTLADVSFAAAGHAHDGPHTTSQSSSHSPAEGHPCSCADLCQIGGAPEIEKPQSQLAALPLARSLAPNPPAERNPAQPTRHLIPLPNPPPLAV